MGLKITQIKIPRNVVATLAHKQQEDFQFKMLKADVFWLYVYFYFD